MVLMEFHISRAARDRYQTDQALFSFNGNVIFADVKASRELAHRMNQVRGTEQDPERVVNPGALFAMGLIDEASHLLDRALPQVGCPACDSRGTPVVLLARGRGPLRSIAAAVRYRVSGSRVYRGEETAKDWLAGSTDGVSHREAAFEEMMMLWLANANPAFQPFLELFDDTPLEEQTPYPDVTTVCAIFRDQAANRRRGRAT